MQFPRQCRARAPMCMDTRTSPRTGAFVCRRARASAHERLCGGTPASPRRAALLTINAIPAAVPRTGAYVYEQTRADQGQAPQNRPESGTGGPIGAKQTPQDWPRGRLRRACDPSHSRISGVFPPCGVHAQGRPLPHVPMQCGWLCDQCSMRSIAVSTHGRIHSCMDRKPSGARPRRPKQPPSDRLS